jgi:hypothetical protein
MGQCCHATSLVCCGYESNLESNLDGVHPARAGSGEGSFGGSMLDARLSGTIRCDGRSWHQISAVFRCDVRPNQLLSGLLGWGSPKSPVSYEEGPGMGTPIDFAVELGS